MNNLPKRISDALEKQWPDIYMEGYYDEEAIPIIANVISEASRQEANLVNACCEDIMQRTKSSDPTRFSVYSHPQTWPNTSCGFGGIAGQAFVTRQTVAILDEDSQEFYIYHAGRFAYKTAGQVRYQVLECIGKQSLPGQRDATGTFGVENVCKGRSHGNY